MICGAGSFDIRTAAAAFVADLFGKFLVVLVQAFRYSNIT